MVNDSTPEEKLLKLIRTKPKKAESATVVSSSKIRAKAPRPKRTSFIEQRFLALGQLVNLRVVSSVLAVIVIVFALYSVLELLASQPRLVLEGLLQDSKKEMPADSALAVPPPKPYAYYAQYLEARDIFAAPFAGERPEAASADQRFSNLSLVGIVVDKTPQAIIEDTKENKTYFLMAGDSIGDVTIESITEKKVTVLSGEQRFDLTLAQ